MLDNQLIKLMGAGILQLFPKRGLDGYKLKRNYQPRQQGRPNDPTVYMLKTLDNRYGFRTASKKWDITAGAIVRTEKQIVQSTFTFACTVNIDPDDTAQLSHSDILKKVASLIASPDFIAYLLAGGAQVMRILDIKNVPYENDKGQFEDNPTFDVIITHTDTFIDGVPLVTKVSGSITRI